MTGTDRKGPTMTQDGAVQGAVVVVREIDASPDAVWRAWRDPDSIRQWWGPTGFTCPRADVDFRVGGTTVVAMQAPPAYGGGVWHSRWTYTALDEPTRIAFVSEFADADGQVIERAAAGMPPGVPAQVPHVVDLAPLAGGGTRMTITETGYTSEQARQQSQAGQEQVVDKMQALLERG
jgi:uncharacterized protein YndB with AHSA1/START domain